MRDTRLEWTSDPPKSRIFAQGLVNGGKTWENGGKTWENGGKGVRKTT